MRMYDIIMKKREGQTLSKEEIDYFVKGFTNGNIPDYQISALMMAVFFKAMNEEETLNLTLSMASSGEMLDLSDIEGVKVDKHSTGGVGDKTSLALLPMVASLGLKVAKMSGRGLGHTGGTIDKLESFPGFSTDISIDEFKSNVKNVGMSIMGQTKDLAPCDKKLYALRDVTATVDNISLIASSIMSKKLAAGADAIVLDVKTGSGAFMKTYDSAYKLAKEMVKIGNNAGRKTIAVISDMDEPLGYAIGNALEVKEAIDTLNGKGPKDFTELVTELGTRMLIAGKVTDSEISARKMLSETISSGRALDKLAEFIACQGGDASYVYHPEKFDIARIELPIFAKEDGYVKRIVCDEAGISSMILGGGRECKESKIDLSVGIILNKKTGDYVEKGETLATVYANDSEKGRTATERLLNAYEIAKDFKYTKQIIKDIITE